MLKAVILTLNEARHIEACIKTLQWTDGVVLFDCFSTDGTVERAREAGAHVIQHPFENFSQQRNDALKAVKAEWILFIDADERVPPELATEIRQALTNTEKVGWWIPRHNYIFGHKMRGAGWRPDYQLRLLKRARAHYDPKREVHEVAVLNGEDGYLEESFIHYNYETLQQFIKKQQRYTDYDASILHGKGVRPKFYTPYKQALTHFRWRFITLNGWRDGIYGVLLSGLMAYYEMIKYKKVRKAQRTKQS